MVFAVLVCPEFSSQVVWLLVFWVLEIVFSVCGSLPNVDNGIRNAFLSLEVNDFAVHQGDKSAWGLVDDDGFTVLAERRVRRPEWPEDGGGSRRTGFGSVLVGDFVNEAVMLLDWWMNIVYPRKKQLTIPIQ